MKTKYRPLIILLIFVLTGMGVSCCFKNIHKNPDEAEKVIINLNELGEKMGTPKEEVTFPDGKFMLQQWDKTHIKKVINELQSCFNEPEKIYLLTDSPAPWITLALIEALQPLKVMYLYPRSDGVELDLCELERGERESNYDVVFEIIDDGDNLFINLNSDRPEAEILVKHTFDTENLCKVVIPEIPEGRHVFIHGKGMFCVTVCVARNYLRNSKSVSLAAHDSDYICAVSYSYELKPGDVTPRTLPNNL